MRAAAGPRALRVAGVLAVLAAPVGAAPGSARDAAASEPRLVVFGWHDGRFEAPTGAPAGVLPVGSLAKPFVARAWAETHPGSAPPVVRCSPASRCWLPSGHGSVGLARAAAVSCNTYFRALAAQTPEPALGRALRAVGFQPPDPLTPEAAIGLATDAGLVAAEPRAILAAYTALLREAWHAGESVRSQLLAGLRDSARSGTASGLGRPGFLAKTGTVPCLDGRALATSGWTVAIDETGRGWLALLTPGTGRETARALGRWLRRGDDRPAPMARSERLVPWAPRDGRRAVIGQPSTTLSVSLLSALAPRHVLARNIGPSPVAAGGRGFVGSGAEIALRAGDRLADGDWELRLPAQGLRRRIRGALRVDAAAADVLRLRAEITADEYVSGVIAAELKAALRPLRVALGAAALRFLSEGPRHGDTDRCDLTHCAFFVGRGPRVAWTGGGRRALLEPPGAGDEPLVVGGDEWQQMLAAARQPGPSRWSSHCGGEPLSPHAVWGGGDRRVFACDRHGASARAAWSRRWARTEVERAFGDRVEDLLVSSQDGTWRLQIQGRGTLRSVSWDEAHARLAGVLGWGALPSPADRVVREGAGFRAEGRGLGHRVGLCLGAGAPDGGR